MKNSDEVLTRRDLRKLLKISDRTIDRWLAKGLLPPSRWPSRWLYIDLVRHYPPLSATSQMGNSNKQ